MALQSRTSRTFYTAVNYRWPNESLAQVISTDRSLSLLTGSTRTGGSSQWTNWAYRTSRAGGSPWTREEYNYYNGPNGWYTNGLDARNHFNTQWYNAVGYSPDPAVFSEAEAIATAKLFAKLRDSRAQWNMAVSLGEARETAQHIAGVARRLSQGFLAIRRFDAIGAWNHLIGSRPQPPRRRRHFFEIVSDRSTRDAAQVWLEVTYAWKPLLGDIDSAAKYLAEKSVEKSWPGLKVTGAHTTTAQGAYLDPTPQGVAYQTRYTWANYASVRLTYEVRPKYLRQPNTLEELGFTNPWLVAWELLPFSFVVDWFVNVGQVLQSLHEFNQWEVVRGIQSSRAGFTRTASLNANWIGLHWVSPNHKKYVENFSPMWLVQNSFSRGITSSFPTSVPLRVLVDNPFDLTSGQMASALALLRSSFSTPRR